MSNQQSVDDLSPLEILFRTARTAQEQRVLRRIVSDWALHDEHSFPAQLAVITLAQWQAAASVPIEVKRLLEAYNTVLTETTINIDQNFNYRLEQLAYWLQAFEESAKRMEEWARELEGEVARLHQTTEAGERHLKKLVADFEYIKRQAHKDLTERVEEHTARLRRWAVTSTSLFVVALIILIWIWGAHHSSSSQSQSNEPQQTVQTP